MIIMDVYFAAAIRGNREYAKYFPIIIRILQMMDCNVLTEHVAHSTGDKLTKPVIYSRDTGWLKISQALVSEISGASTGVGYEIRDTFADKKPVLVLFHKSADFAASPMIVGNTDYPDLLTVKSYGSIDDLVEAIVPWVWMLKEVVSK